MSGPGRGRLLRLLLLYTRMLRGFGKKERQMQIVDFTEKYVADAQFDQKNCGERLWQPPKSAIRQLKPCGNTSKVKMESKSKEKKE